MRALIFGLALSVIFESAVAQQRGVNPQMQFRKLAVSTIAAERDREKQNACPENPAPDSLSLAESIPCLDGEADRSTEKYQDLKSAIDELLHIYQSGSIPRAPVQKDFDRAELIWGQYLKVQCEVVNHDVNIDDKRGHATVEGAARCRLAAMRQHIYELDGEYGGLWKYN